MSVLSVSAGSAVPEDEASEDEASAAGVIVAPVLLSASALPEIYFRQCQMAE